VIFEEPASIDEMDPGVVEPEADRPRIRAAPRGPQRSENQRTGKNRNEEREESRDARLAGHLAILHSVPPAANCFLRSL